MKLIAVGTETPQQSEFVFTSLEEAIAKGRVKLEDVAFAGEEGVVHTKGKLSRLFGAKIDDGRVTQSKPWVFALGAEEQVDAVARRVRTVTKGAMKTYDVQGAELVETKGYDETFALPGETEALLQDSEELPLGGDTMLPKRMFS